MLRMKQIDYERLGALMNMKRASAVSMYGRAVRKLEKVYGVSAEGGTAKSPAKQAGGRKRRKKNQDPDSESEPEPDAKVEAKNDVPGEAQEGDVFTSKSQPTD